MTYYTSVDIGNIHVQRCDACGAVVRTIDTARHSDWHADLMLHLAAVVQAQYKDITDEITAIETTLGIMPQGRYTSVASRLSALERRAT